MTQDDPRAGSATSRSPATILESVAEIRAQARRPSTIVESLARPTIEPGPIADDDGTRPFRPVLRPALALLHVLDDGSDEGEVIRIRSETFVIGRVEGDLRIPHDAGISGRHAEIGRRAEAGSDRWYLRDLRSTNGTFVRVARSVLRDGQEMLIGGVRLRFEAASPPDRDDAGGHVRPSEATQRWPTLARAAVDAKPSPALIELTPEGERRRFGLDGAEHWAGRDPRRCSIALDDPLVSARHARFFRDDRGRWHVQNARSLNGLWLRIEEIPLNRGGQFQCGEQRFLIKIP